MLTFLSEQNPPERLDVTFSESNRAERAATSCLFDDYFNSVSRSTNREGRILNQFTSEISDRSDETIPSQIRSQGRVNRVPTISGDALNAQYRPTIAEGSSLSDFQRTNLEGPISAPVNEENLEERQLAVLSALDSAMTNSPHEAQFNRDLAVFLNRTDITQAQRVAALENLAAIASRMYDRTNSHRSGMNDSNLQTAIAGGINDIAHPTGLDQGQNQTCNFTVLQEGQATLDPVRYTAQLREAALHGTYTGNDGFRAIIPPAMLTPHAEAIGSQDADGARNFSSQLLQAGGLNHLWQQRGQYYTDCDVHSEMRYTFDPTQANPFTTRNGTAGPGMTVNYVGFMGRNFGLQGQFLVVRPEWVAGQQQQLDSAIIVVRTQAAMMDAMRERRWSVLLTHSGDRYFTGEDGVGFEDGCHVISATIAKNGTSILTSNQWGSQHDRTGRAEEVWQAMAMDHMSRWRGSGTAANNRRFESPAEFGHRTPPARIQGLVRQTQ